MSMHNSIGAEAACTQQVAFVTLGCAKNEVDTARMKRALRAAGYTVGEDPEQAQCVVVNTCSFIQDATEESLDTIFELAQLPSMRENGAKIIAAGCMPARYGNDLQDELTEAQAFVPCSKEDDIAAVVASLIGPGAAVGTPNAVELGAHDYEPTAGPFSTYVKISDGCDRFCSYCTIPYIRGRYHSFDFATVQGEVRSAVEAGVREVILIAQDTGRWGADFDEPRSLAWLMGTLAEEFPQTWFRVMYVQPEGITDELLTVMRDHANICRYLDIPLQHVNGKVLKDMNRTGDRAYFDQVCAHVRQMVPGITLRTTLIAGFPGETDDQFEELCDFVEECDFDYIGVFPYSQEEGTRAASMPDQLSPEEKQDRAQRVRDLADAVCTARVAERAGQRVTVLIEGLEEDGQLYGRAMSQAPEVDGCTYVNGGNPGDVVEVTVTDTLFYEMEGEL
ncbi:MAG: 30S ribosomal protein S12 methylthiotransferase RimO [Coriobacteriia bacterium]|nr:30S ribosomal protein S12 methylthiotransferase RimO [Coriobacteriia bacterium]